MKQKTEMTKTFALIGAAAYIAERHIKAIKDNGGELIEIVDVCDIVGIIDRYFPNCKYSTKLTTKPDYVSICTPNYLHYDHIKQAVELGCNVICEKPVVLKSHQIDELEALADLKGVSINCILQLRLSPAVDKIKRKIKPDLNTVELTYLTPRGDWYGKSWKGDKEKSGGLLFNIGIHFFDLLIHLFGDNYTAKYYGDGQGSLLFNSAICNFHLSTSFALAKEPTRVLKINGVGIDLTKGFDNGHTLSYERILKGEGFDISEAKASIELIESINK